MPLRSSPSGSGRALRQFERAGKTNRNLEHSKNKLCRKAFPSRNSSVAFASVSVTLWIARAALKLPSASALSLRQPPLLGNSNGMEKHYLEALDVMKPPIFGSCLCGQVSYVCTSSPVWSVNCHCRSCQRLSGAPYVSAFSVLADSFRSMGETVRFRRQSDAGHSVTTTHCSNCGSRMNAQSSGAAHLINIFASTLTEPSSFVPVSNVYLSEAAAWITPPPAQFNFPKMPHR